jgi:hypothetical protein
MYSALKNVSDIQKMHTRSDAHGQNINDVINRIEGAFNVSPEEDDENM